MEIFIKTRKELYFNEILLRLYVTDETVYDIDYNSMEEIAKFLNIETECLYDNLKKYNGRVMRKFKYNNGFKERVHMPYFKSKDEVNKFIEEFLQPSIITKKLLNT